MRLSKIDKDTGLVLGKFGIRRRFNSSSTILDHLTINKKTIVGSAVFLVAFFSTFVASSLLAPIAISDATNQVSAEVSYEGYFVKLDSTDVNMRLITTPSGSMTVVESTVKTVTNSPNGYKLYLSMSPYDSLGNEKSAADKQKNGLYLDGDLSRTDNMVFNAASGKGGSLASASLAPLTDNTWGYAVDKNTEGAPTIWQNEEHSIISSGTPTNDKFAAVPKATSVDLIQETTTSSLSYDTPIEDVQDSDYTSAKLYYGIRGTAARQGGSYSNTIAYTAVGKISPTSNITFDPATYVFPVKYEEMTWTDTVTIQTPISTTAEDLGTASVYFSGGPDNVSGLSCTNPTLSVFNNLLNVTCTLPQAHAGTYDVVVSLDKYGQIYTGSYTYEDPFSAVYTLHISNTNTSTPNVQTVSVPYGGTTTVEVVPDKGYYLSSIICPNGYTCTGNTGTSAIETQTVTIENNNLASGGTISFVGVAGKPLTQLTYMQEMTTANCAASAEGDTKSLIDIRDSKTYTVKKLADGNCWMTQNLRLLGPMVLTSANSNVTRTHTLPAPTTAYLNSNQGTAEPYQAWCASSEAWCVNREVSLDSGDNTHGVYYNYVAATAGIGTTAIEEEQISSSICPKGWQLPTGGADGEFLQLYNIYSSYNAMTNNSGPKFVLSGYDYGPTITAKDSEGIYWSKTAFRPGGVYRAYVLRLVNTGVVQPTTDYAGYRYYGHTIRCIAQ